MVEANGIGDRTLFVYIVAGRAGGDSAGTKEPLEISAVQSRVLFPRDLRDSIKPSVAGCVAVAREFARGLLPVTRDKRSICSRESH